MPNSHDDGRDKKEEDLAQVTTDDSQETNGGRRPAKPNRRLNRHAVRTSGVLPLVPLRGMVIYPGVLLSFDIGREQSVPVFGR